MFADEIVTKLRAPVNCCQGSRVVCWEIGGTFKSWEKQLVPNGPQGKRPVIDIGPEEAAAGSVTDELLTARCSEMAYQESWNGELRMV